MKKRAKLEHAKLEHILERNKVLSSDEPVPVELAQRHLEALMRAVQRNGRIFTLLARGEAIAIMRRCPEQP